MYVATIHLWVLRSPGGGFSDYLDASCRVELRQIVQIGVNNERFQGADVSLKQSEACDARRLVFPRFCYGPFCCEKKKEIRETESYQ